MALSKQLTANVVIGVIVQIVSFALGFVSRTFFVRYIGVEILGLSETLSSIISTLSLVDLGFYSVVIYRLYNPLSNKNYEECNKILAVLKRFYICVAGIIAVLFVCAVPLLKYFLNGIEITPFVYFAYGLICLNAIVSYFVAYKRSLLYADGKDSVAKTADCFCNIVFTAARIAVIIQTGNFLLFLILTILQTVVSNFVLHIYCKRHYVWLKRTEINKNIQKLLFSDSKNVFFGKLAGYVYSATDNLVISFFLKTVTVGFYSNYIMIHSALRLLGSAVLSQIAPFVGKKYAEDNDSAVHENILLNCSFLCFVLAGIFVVPLFLLTDGFIQSWLGNEYVLPVIILFLCADLYIEIQQSAFCLYLGAAGLFDEDKKISIAGALCNILGSVVLVIVFGLPGVIAGTVFSQVLYWILRGRCILRVLFKSESSYIAKYLKNNLLYIAVLLLTIFILKFVLQYISFDNYTVSFVSQGIVCEICFFLVSAVFLGRTEPYKFAIKTILNRK